MEISLYVAFIALISAYPVIKDLNIISFIRDILPNQIKAIIEGIISIIYLSFFVILLRVRYLVRSKRFYIEKDATTLGDISKTETMGFEFGDIKDVDKYKKPPGLFK